MLFTVNKKRAFEGSLVLHNGISPYRIIFEGACHNTLIACMPKAPSAKHAMPGSAVVAALRGGCHKVKERVFLCFPRGVAHCLNRHRYF